MGEIVEILIRNNLVTFLQINRNLAQTIHHIETKSRFLDMKIFLVVLLTLLPFLHAQSLCPILQEGFQPCTDTMVEEMQHVVEISGHQPDYYGFLAEKYEEYLQTSEGHHCI